VRIPGRLRARLALRAGLLAAASFAAMGVVMEFALVRPLGRELDADLLRRVDGLAAAAAADGRSGFHRVAEVAFAAGRDRFAALHTAAGVLVESAGRALPPGAEALPPGRTATVEDPVSGEFRVLRRAVDAPGEGSLVVMAGVSMEETRARQAEIRFLLVLAALGGTALVAGGAAAGAGLVLDPLRAMTEAARKADAATADVRMPDRGRGDEFDDLARLINDLLARAGVSIEEERRFAGEAAHELRSPLSVLRLRAEDALAEKDPAALRSALEASLTDVDRVERLVRALLELSRATPDRPPPSTLVDVGVVVGSLAEDLATLARTRGLELGFRPPLAPVPVAVPREVVETTVSVLVDNAFRYTPRGGRVTVEVGPGRVVVSDTGPGVAADEAERVFDRLFRGKAGRASGAGFGLGLALARRLARSAGGDVVLENPGEAGARFAVLFPGG
jgi:signal transduction histidine kinase